ncbi:MAG: hypothetical protein ABIG94_04015, partial [Pseudomonadota bacterium]
MGKSLIKIAIATVSYARYPFGVTCLECGFLALGEKEVGTADRILLHIRGTAGCPPLKELQCFRSLWVDYDLIYAGTDENGIFDEVQKQRRNCQGFFPYRPGWSPTGHKDLLQKRLERREKVFLVVLGLFIGSLLTFLSTRLTKFFSS